ncbi:N-acetylglucosamine-6-sulfatase-like [Dreissena polymorpha]|uniref:Sulfatase N-terminal domain-containing protein n=1 Tax=Dreissena polymorpha TaxID=45954 RepID=A0A9D4MJI1_DREPO|nr:N-acetylglucosamine-6-sulfatase-like [Dreissena polymorpha]KAH3877270.1 hypothetical protein DPMN_001133 [Dreissena polymorpha]
MKSVCVFANLLLWSWSIVLEAKDVTKPNFVFVLTDDQDITMGGQEPMVKTKALIGDQGIMFSNMFVSSPLCCPSRSSILSGRYVHNHHAYNNTIDGGCNGPEWQEFEDELFPSRLQYRGYQTFFAGKYLNAYGAEHAGGVKHVPTGWDFWHGLVGNSVYYNYTLSVNGKAERHGDNYENDYLTDLIHRRGVEFLKNRNMTAPFFMMLSTPSCHDPFTPAPQYNASFPEAQVPRTGNYNMRGKNKHWLIEKTIVPLPNDTVVTGDGIYRRRWQTLLSVDDMVADVVQTLEDQGVLNNTYIFFTSDNGYHLGQFGLPDDKRQMYEFDIRVPLMVRGPGIKAGQISKEVVANIDLAPTFMDLAADSFAPGADGISMRAILRPEDHVKRPVRDTILVEHVGEYQDMIPECPEYNGQGMANCNPHCVCEDSVNNTFACMIQFSEEQMLKTCQFLDSMTFVEIYDTKSDPYEFNNLDPSMDADMVSGLQHQLLSILDCKENRCHVTGFQESKCYFE